MRPATPRHPKHDAACPFCGEPFLSAKLMGRKVGDYRCARCGGEFMLLGEQVWDTRIKGAPAKMASWVGEPMEGSQG